MTRALTHELDQDVFTLPPERIREAKVVLTVSGGKVLVER
jgi:predicted amidohydrolase YtcJ